MTDFARQSTEKLRLSLRWPTVAACLPPQRGCIRHKPWPAYAAHWPLWVLGVLSLGLTVCLPRVRAQEPPPASALDLAVQHFEAVEFDAAREAAYAALRTGTLDSPLVARAYEIIGVSAAAVGDYDEARVAYQRLLALDPNARASDILPPEKNRAFYEAQGYWFSQVERFSLVVEALDSERVEVRVRDPLEMASELTYGPGDVSSPRARRLLPVRAPFVITFAEDTPRALSFELRDRYGNLLAQSEVTLPAKGPVLAKEPAQPVPSAAPLATPTAPVTRSEREKSWLRSPWLWGAVSLVVAGAATTGIWLAVREPHVRVRTDLRIEP